MSQQSNNGWWIGAVTVVGVIIAGLTFYWTQLRGTKLTVFKPSQYYVVDGCLRLILTFKADGPKPIIVQDLRLLRPEGKNPLLFKFTLEDIESVRHKNKTSFAVTADQPGILVCEFTLPTEE